jgi:hypothetical protein
VPMFTKRLSNAENSLAAVSPKLNQSHVSQTHIIIT